MLTALDPRHVRLAPSPFAAARDRNADWLLALDPKRLLHGFYKNAGLPTEGDIYGGWEQQSLAGHSLGHYLSACVRLAAEGDVRFTEIVALILSELKRCQDARQDYFIGGMPEADRVFGELREGIVRARNFDLNDCWVPWYNLHKLFAGLLDAAKLLESPLAFDLVYKLGHWTAEVTANLDDASWQAMLSCEFGGMSESFAELYARTDEEPFLELAEKFYHRVVLDPLAAGIDCLPGLHGNTQIPKIIGCARLYEVTGDEKYKKIAENFWRFVVESHSYVIGGHGSNEHFGPAGELAQRLTHSTCETCNSYNMHKLTEHLFCWEPKAEYADFAERVRINHILASQNPETGMVCYFVSLLSGHFKHYSTPEDSFWCCVGTGWENHTRYGDGVFFEDAANTTLYVTQFLSCSCVAPEQMVGLTLATAFPQGSAVTLQIATHELSVPFTLKLRQPGWLSTPLALSLNGSPVSAEQTPDGFLTLTRTWREDDRITFEIPLPARHEALLGAPDKLALLHGPVVLAADLGAAPPPGDADGGEPFNAQIPPAPVLLDPETCKFEREVALVPFYQLHGRRQAVYFDRFSESAWAEQEATYRATEAGEHAQRTKLLDTFWPNQMQPERDHNFTGEGYLGGERSAWKFRQAGRGGWFVFTLRTLPDSPMELVCTWGPPQESDVAFTVEVEGVPVARPQLTVERHRHLHETYPLPEALTQGKESITVRVLGESAPLFLAKLQKHLQ
ncbi:beta-L-arabinofuranosidase domain-containing protein [Armatimonas rosea]|uniref:Glycosyl hydrolase n=1 Tax=Armatimonas rosea TaxID=685828 RepID=A0A7W9W9Q7_ARMRO|nr:beta-L-arabinofuranosidase domain-containing protein [Armatimonas rosea]MBB6053551.1 hypothetical protein [Armatimonas rosea]